MHATPWALDELEGTDIFSSFSGSLPSLAAEHGDAAGAISPEERARIEEEAYARGRADGERTARVDANARVSSAVAALAEALDTTGVHQARWIANAEENLAVLAVGIARHIIAREVESDPAVIAALVQRALTQFPLDQVVTVRLHPDDVAAGGTLLMAESSGRTHEIRWAADPHLQRGGCLVEGRERIIDGRVDTALERVYRSIGSVQ